MHLKQKKVNKMNFWELLFYNVVAVILAPYPSILNHAENKNNLSIYVAQSSRHFIDVNCMDKDVVQKY